MGPMSPKEILKIAETVGLGPKELAHLLGISVRTIRRGARLGGTVDTLLRGIQEKLADPHAVLSIRALTIIAARGEGMKTLVARLLHAYVTMDLLHR